MLPGQMLVAFSAFSLGILTDTMARQLCSQRQPPWTDKEVNGTTLSLRSMPDARATSEMETKRYLSNGHTVSEGRQIWLVGQ